MITEITDNQFQQEVLDSHIPVIVDFYSPTCAPCKVLMPMLEDLSERIVGVKFVKMNIATTTSYQTYEISSLPTLIKFNESKAVASLSGVKPRLDLVRFINS